jgi:hypothetical protein
MNPTIENKTQSRNSNPSRKPRQGQFQAENPGTQLSYSQAENPRIPTATSYPNNHGSATETYHWTLLRRGLRAKGPSIILCAKKWSLPAPQRRGSPHSGEGKNGRDQPITTERSSYKKIPLVGFQDLYKTDSQNLFRANRATLRGFPAVVTQILGPIWGFSLKVPGRNFGVWANFTSLGNTLADIQCILYSGIR